MKSFTDGSSPPQVHGTAASDPEPAYRQRAIEWWETNIQNTISGLGDDFATWRKVCLRIRLIRRNKLFGDWKMARPVCIRICWMLWLWPCKRHVVPSWTLTHEKLCRNRHFQIVRLTESRTFFDFYFSQFFCKNRCFHFIDSHVCQYPFQNKTILAGPPSAADFGGISAKYLTSQLYYFFINWVQCAI